MSPRAACRLEALGFEHVYDYVAGKAEWLAYGLPREGEKSGVLYAGEAVDGNPPTCRLETQLDTVAALLDGSRYGFCVVLSDSRIVLGRVRKSAINGTDSSASAEAIMEPGPSTVRCNLPATELAERLAKRSLENAIVTTPNGCLVGIFSRRDLGQHGPGHSRRKM
jgi:CBS domain-containing protein